MIKRAKRLALDFFKDIIKSRDSFPKKGMQAFNMIVCICCTFYQALEITLCRKIQRQAFII